MSNHNSHVPWREWGDEAFAEAQAQDKPILLDIGAVWCHWCHVMDDGIPGDPVHSGTYSHPEVLERIAEHFIPIKVDNDRRPDINARYNMGGWPTTAFLNPEGEMIYGETYVPPARMVGLLDHIADLYRNHRAELDEQTVRMRETRALSEALPPESAPLDPDTARNVAAAIKASFDAVYGGFGRQPKFPHPSALEFTLEHYAKTGDPEMRAVAEKTMRAMAGGGMYDKYAGGFFRYSTTRDWSIPHYEKMLEDNAGLTKACALASVVLNDDQYMETVRSAHGWLLNDMRDPETGAFAGSQDADEEEHYYGKPLDERAKLPTPYIDRTVYAGWNAMMASALANRYMITGEEEILKAAIQTFAFLCCEMQVDEDDSARRVRLYHFHADGRPQGTIGLLADETDFATAALDLYEATGERDFLKDAVGACAYILSELQDPNGGFFDVKPDPDAIGELARPKKEIGDNSNAALALLRLGNITNDMQYREAALRALQVFTSEYQRLAYFAAPYARAVEAALRPPLHIVVVGEHNNADTSALLRAAWTTVSPGKTAEILRPSVMTHEELLARGFPASEDGSPRAFVCIGTTCLAPVGSADDLKQAVADAVNGGRG